MLIEPGLYAASEQRLLERLRAVQDAIESLMLIDHNPGLEQLALRLAARGGSSPTCGASTRWGRLRRLRSTAAEQFRSGSAEPTDFVTPMQPAKR